MKIVGLILPALLLAACTSYRSVRVSVRDGISHEPVPDARVQLRPVHLFWPTYDHGIVTPSPHERADAVTDATGTASLQAPARHAFELFVLIPWEAARGVTIEELGDPAWVELRPGEDDGDDARTIEVSIQ